MSDELELHPELFVLRLWRVQLPDGRFEWRGRLQHPQTNEIRHFRDWPALIPSLLAMLREIDTPTPRLIPPGDHQDETETSSF